MHKMYFTGSLDYKIIIYDGILKNGPNLNSGIFSFFFFSSRFLIFLVARKNRFSLLNTFKNGRIKTYL